MVIHSFTLFILSFHPGSRDLGRGCVSGCDGQGRSPTGPVGFIAWGGRQKIEQALPSPSSRGSIEVQGGQGAERARRSICPCLEVVREGCLEEAIPS